MGQEFLTFFVPTEQQDRIHDSFPTDIRHFLGRGHNFGI